MMNRKDRDNIKDRLIAKISRSKNKIDRMEEMTKPISPENAIGRLSRMDAINNKSVMEAALRTAKKELSGLQNALRHVEEDPDFGICKKCKNPIPLPRLLLLPGTIHCVSCAS